MEGRICSQVFVAALLCAAASFATLADQAKQADQTKPAGKAKTAKPPASPPGSPAAGAASASKSSPGNDLTSPVAYIGDRSITLQDLALNLAQKMMGQWEFDQKKQALDDLINDRLLEKEAAAKGVPKEKLIDTEVTSKIPDPAQSEIDAWYEQNKARVGTQTKDQLTPQIKAMLRSQTLADGQKN